MGFYPKHKGEKALCICDFNRSPDNSSYIHPDPPKKGETYVVDGLYYSGRKLFLIFQEKGYLYSWNAKKFVLPQYHKKYLKHQTEIKLKRQKLKRSCLKIAMACFGIGIVLQLIELAGMFSYSGQDITDGTISVLFSFTRNGIGLTPYMIGFIVVGFLMGLFACKQISNSKL